MGRDNQPKDRQLRRKATKEARRAGYARILIVTEGSKTEPLYLEEIRCAYQLHSANVEVQPGRLGTAPIQRDRKFNRMSPSIARFWSYRSCLAR